VTTPLITNTNCVTYHDITPLNRFQQMYAYVI